MGCVMLHSGVFCCGPAGSRVWVYSCSRSPGGPLFRFRGNFRLVKPEIFFVKICLIHVKFVWKILSLCAFNHVNQIII